MKWYHVREMQEEGLDIEVSNRIRLVLTILDEAYGSYRKPMDDGGYVLLINDTNVKELEQFLQSYPSSVVEFYEAFQTHQQGIYYELLILLSSDYAVTLFMCQSLWNRYKYQFNLEGVGGE